MADGILFAKYIGLRRKDQAKFKQIIIAAGLLVHLHLLQCYQSDNQKTWLIFIYSSGVNKMDSKIGNGMQKERAVVKQPHVMKNGFLSALYKRRGREINLQRLICFYVVEILQAYNV